eukprot:TRINITY_DN5140_c0_g1_i1.p1 TRINITY_DN5140_c0_g1~~TRINITY_DN5140_c0_g1_i1.p1  ORF type:complete len:505 (+),score=118.37 TRINITY_DN5140_c0_g1_i1:129-1643(+)
MGSGLRSGTLVSGTVLCLALCLSWQACGAGAAAPDAPAHLTLTLEQTSTDHSIGLAVDPNMYVVTVDRASPAERAGFQTGMRLGTINDVYYLDRDGAIAKLSQVGTYRVGVTLGCLRYVDLGQQARCNAEPFCTWSKLRHTCMPSSIVGEQDTPAPTPAPPPPSTWPMAAGPGTASAGSRAGDPRFPTLVTVQRATADDDVGLTVDGALVVTYITPGLPLDTAGVIPGMRIVGVGTRLVLTPVELYDALQRQGKQVVLAVVPHCSAITTPSECNAQGPTGELPPGCTWDTHNKRCVGSREAGPSVDAASTTQDPLETQNRSAAAAQGGESIGTSVGIIMGVAVGGLCALLCVIALFCVAVHYRRLVAEERREFQMEFSGWGAPPSPDVGSPDPMPVCGRPTKKVESWQFVQHCGDSGSEPDVGAASPDVGGCGSSVAATGVPVALGAGVACGPPQRPERVASVGRLIDEALCPSGGGPAPQRSGSGGPGRGRLSYNRAQRDGLC